MNTETARTRWLFQPEYFDLPTLHDLRVAWRNIPCYQSHRLIAEKHQYLHFHFFILESLRSNKPPDTYTHPLDYSVRAGAIHTGVITVASIAELALWAHGVERGYKVKNMFGNIINGWEREGQGLTADVQPIWDDIKDLKDWRNDVHLNNSVEKFEDWEHIYHRENELWTKHVAILECLQQIESPYHGS